MRGGLCGSKRGSYTIEATLVMTLILTALSAVMVLGFRSAQLLVLEMRETQREWQAREPEDYPAMVRIGQASVSLFGEE